MRTLELVYWASAALLAVVGIIGLAVSVAFFCRVRLPPFDFGVVLDAGSSKTRTTLFKWAQPKDNGTGKAIQVDTCKVNGGIADQDPDIENLQNYFQDCVGDVLDSVSEAKAPPTLFLAATAGMRLLRLEDQEKAGQVLTNAQAALESYPVEVKNVHELEGIEEGASAWITLNYLEEKLNWPSPNATGEIETVGSLDLGGASTQITFESPHTQVPGSYLELELYGRKYYLFSHSYLCFGANEAVNRFFAELVHESQENLENDNATILNPCGNRGNYITKTSEQIQSPCTLPLNFPSSKSFKFIGTSDFEKCSAKVADLFNVEVCQSKYSKLCFDSSIIPPKDQPFVGISGFAYVLNDLKLPEPLNELDVKQLLEKSCRNSWEELLANLEQINEKFLPEFCLRSHYAFYLLTQVYQFTGSKWHDVTFKTQVEGAELGWSLGYIINATNAIPAKPPYRLLAEEVFSPLVVTCLILLIASTALAHVAWRYRRRYRLEENAASQSLTQKAQESSVV